MKLKIIALLGVGLLAGPMAAQAGSYAYTTIDYPGADNTQAFGINERGMIAGVAVYSAMPSIGFVYDARTGLFTPLPTMPGYQTGLIGINEPGTGVGSAGELDTGVTSGFIFDKGASTLFAHPGSSMTVARAISNTGLVTGYADGADGSVFGFLHDPATGKFVDFMPSAFTIAQGINGRGEIVGSATLAANVAYPGSPGGAYGFLRARNGQVTLFRVNGLPTRARGISDKGTITGFAGASGFVATLPARGGFQALTIPDGDLLVVPAAVAVNPQGIDNSGNVVGIYTDENSVVHGFLAEPIK
jgi:uncharacterized membrane protein